MGKFTSLASFDLDIRVKKMKGIQGDTQRRMRMHHTFITDQNQETRTMQASIYIKSLFQQKLVDDMHASLHILVVAFPSSLLPL